MNESSCSHVLPCLSTFFSASSLVCDFLALQSSIVGLVYRQSVLIQRDVFLVELLPVVANAMVEEASEELALKSRMKRGAIMTSDQVGINEQNMSHLKAIMIIQPTAKNLEHLKVLLLSPRYNEYHICKKHTMAQAYTQMPYTRSIHIIHTCFFLLLISAPSLSSFSPCLFPSPLSFQQHRSPRLSREFSRSRCPRCYFRCSRVLPELLLCDSKPLPF